MPWFHDIQPRISTLNLISVNGISSIVCLPSKSLRGRRVRDRMVVEFTNTCATSGYQH
jgi:hypothetical protein